MQALTRRSVTLGAVAAVMLVMVTSGTASARRTTGTTTGGGKHHRSIDSTAAAYQVTYDPADLPPGHALSAPSGWTPPACWLAPVATPRELQTEREGVWAEESTGAAWDQAQADYYKNGHPHKDFEIANTGKGMWWNGVANPNRLADPASLGCFQERDSWVLNGKTPAARRGPVVTPKILAESAYDRIRIPDKVVALSPGALDVQTVNLTTWAWLDSADLPPVSVTASLASLNIWATTTAKPVGLHLDAGTPDADLYPASGNCGLNDDGSVGEKYVPADGNDVPPCGLRYLRSSGNGTYALTATITWEVTWKGSGGTGGGLGTGVFDTTQNVTVQEAQTVNR
jgi:enoyl reductase